MIINNQSDASSKSSFTYHDVRFETYGPIKSQMDNKVGFMEWQPRNHSSVWFSVVRVSLFRNVTFLWYVFCSGELVITCPSPKERPCLVVFGSTHVACGVPKKRMAKTPNSKLPNRSPMGFVPVKTFFYTDYVSIYMFNIQTT